MRTWRISRVALLAIAVLAVAAPRSDAQVSKLDGRVDARTRAEIVGIIDSAMAAGLPAELSNGMVSRALMYASKGASREKIVGELRSYARRLDVARRALGAATVDEIQAAEGALLQGVRATTLATLRQARPRESVSVALVVLSDLIVRRVPVDTASALILAVAGTAAGDETYYGLRSAVAQDIEAGALPVVAASTRTRGVLGSGAAAGITESAAPGDLRSIPTTQNRPTGGAPPPRP